MLSFNIYGVLASTLPIREYCPGNVTHLAHHKMAKPRCIEDCLTAKPLAVLTKSYCQRLHVEPLIWLPLYPLSQKSYYLHGFKYLCLYPPCQFWSLRPNLPVRIIWLCYLSQQCFLCYQALLQTSKSLSLQITAFFRTETVGLETHYLVKIPAMRPWASDLTSLCQHFLILKNMRCFE